MSRKLLHNRVVIIVCFFLSLPVIMALIMGFTGDGTNGAHFSVSGFQELFRSSRTNELLVVTRRTLLVASLATIISFLVSLLLIRRTPILFQAGFFVLITLPFLINEAVRVFSWQYFLSEDGAVNRIVSFIAGDTLHFSNGSNPFNIYLVMIMTCIPFGIFINSASLKTLPPVYWRTSSDLKLNAVAKFFKVVLPLSKGSLVASFVIIFFVSFSLSSEVNFLGGDTKLSVRNLISSLMSASRFQAIFSLGAGMILLLFGMFTLYIMTSRRRKMSIQ